MGDKNNGNLLVVSSFYPYKNVMRHTFVKSQVKYLSKFYNKIFVVVVIPYFPRFLKNLKFLSPIITDKAYLRNYEYENVEVIFVRYFYFPFLKKYRSSIAFNRVSKLFIKMKLKVDYCYAHFTLPGGGVARLIKNKFGLNYTLVVHENHDWLIEELEDPEAIDVWKEAKNIIRVNKADVSLLKKYNDNVVSIPNGYDPDVFIQNTLEQSRAKLKIDLDRIVISNIGFYERKKGQIFLIEAISLLPEKIKDRVECYIIGGGPLKEELQRKIDEYNLHKQVFLLGKINQTELFNWLNASDYFCLPSLSEGNPTVMFEALGCGIPFIGTNISGVNEVIKSEEIGLLCEPSNADSLMEGILRATKKTWDRNRIRAHSEKFQWEEIVNRIQKIIIE